MLRGGTLGWILRSCHCFLGRVYFGKPTFGIYGWTGKTGWSLSSAVGVGRWWCLYLQSTLCLEKLSWIFCSRKRRLMWDQMSPIRMNKQIYPNYRLWIQCVWLFSFLSFVIFLMDWLAVTFADGANSIYLTSVETSGFKFQGDFSESVCGFSALSLQPVFEKPRVYMTSVL